MVCGWSSDCDRGCLYGCLPLKNARGVFERVREEYEDCKTRDARKVGCLCLKSVLTPAGIGLVQQKHASHSRAPASEISRACMYQPFKDAHAVTLAVNHVASIQGLEGQARIAEPHRTTEDLISPH